jgi:hypothetical protein
MNVFSINQMFANYSADVQQIINSPIPITAAKEAVPSLSGKRPQTSSKYVRMQKLVRERNKQQTN